MDVGLQRRKRGLNALTRLERGRVKFKFMLLFAVSKLGVMGSGCESPGAGRCDKGPSPGSAF